MNYSTFKDTILSSIQEKLGSTVTVAIQDVTKNNDTHLDGLTILSDHLNISPTIYLNYYYNQYTNGSAISEILDEILLVYEENKPRENIDISFFTDYDLIKDRIVYKLVNYERNKDLLSQIPYFRILDLAIVFNCLIETDSSGSATILIYNQHLSLWNIQKEDLYTLSMKNTPLLLPSLLQSFSTILEDLMEQSDTSFDSLDEDTDQLLHTSVTDVPMYILTNQNKLHGSACILYHNVLKNFAAQLGCDLYILPSSIHEVLLIPVSYASEMHSYEDLSAMVQDVNASQVLQEEILSDHVYYFSRESGKISM